MNLVDVINRHNEDVVVTIDDIGRYRIDFGDRTFFASEKTLAKFAIGPIREEYYNQ